MSSLPNLHPALVHFPIALVFAALGFDLAALVRRRATWLDRGAAALYGLAAVGAVAAYLAGRAAEDSLGRLPAAAQEAVAEHADLGLWTLVLFLALAVLRSWLAWRARGEQRVRSHGFRLALLVAAGGACALVLETAEHGGALVYRHGLAVAGGPGGAPRSGAGVAAEAPSARTVGPELAAGAPAGSARPTSGSGEAADPSARLHRGGDGSVHWMPSTEDGAALGTILQAAPGSDAKAVAAIPPREGAEGLGLAVDGRVLLVLAGRQGDVEVSGVFDWTGFQGTIGLVHHAVDTQNYGVFTLSTAGRAELAARRAGKETLLDGKAVQIGGDAHRLAVSSAGRHLKGVLGEAVVAHGHVEPGAAGACGLLLDGRGTVRIRELMIMPLQKEQGK